MPDPTPPAIDPLGLLPLTGRLLLAGLLVLTGLFAVY